MTRSKPSARPAPTTPRAVDCVVFDIGNVLLRWDPRHLYRRMGYDDAAIAAVFAETDLAQVNHRQLDGGAPNAETLTENARQFPRHRAFFEAWDTRWIEMLDGAIEANVALLADLRAAAVPVHALSNFSAVKFEVTRALFPFLDTFDTRVISADIGLVKPDREIFEYLTAAAHLDPARAVFIDDSAANIAAARAFGFHTVHYTSEAVDARAALRGLGLPV